MIEVRTFPHIAKLVRDSRLNTVLSQEGLSGLLGYKNGQFISNVERELCSIPTKRIGKLCEELKIERKTVIEAKKADFLLNEYAISSLYSEQ